MKKILSKLRGKRFLKAAAISLVLLAAIIFYILFGKLSERVFIDDSLIQSPIITVSPATTGTVREIDVKEGQSVSRGDTLAVVGSETLRADTNGLIVSASDLTGSTVTPQTPLIQMIAPVNLRVAGTVDETKGLGRIKVGQAVSFTIDAFPGYTYWGFVDEISPNAKQTQLSFTISSERPTQQFVVYARFDSARYPEIKNGMSSKMTVYTKTQ
jgi:multidrug resistance efflux pump